MLKPQLADNANLDTILYPCWVQPKIDGVRALNLEGDLTGRSLDSFKGFGISSYFSKPEFVGFDGEMILEDDPASPDRLCSRTTGAIGKFVGVTEMANIFWYLFDFVTADTIKLPYAERYKLLSKQLCDNPHPRLRLVPYRVCSNREELDASISEYASAGYEGTIIRNPDAKCKGGRPSKKIQELVRVKPFGDFEILVLKVTEGQMNENEVKTNSLGYTERSSAKAGMVPNGQVGSIQGTMLVDFHCPITGRLLFPAGMEVTAGSGKMTAAEATHYFQNQNEIVGHYVKVKTMTHGVKDKPRFPTFESIRIKEDM